MQEKAAVAAEVAVAKAVAVDGAKETPVGGRAARTDNRLEEAGQMLPLAGSD